MSTTTQCPNETQDNSISPVIIVGITLASISTLVFLILFLRTRISEYKRQSTLQATKDYCCHLICRKNDTRIDISDESENYIKFKKNLNRIVSNTYDTLISFNDTDIIELIAINHNAKCHICDEILDNKICKVPCGHMFHKHCVIDWMRYNNHCPKCDKIII